MSADGARRLKWTGLLSISVLALVAVTLCGWLVVRGLSAKDQLVAAVEASQNVVAAASTSDLAAALPAVRTMQEHTAAAAALTSDPIWRAAETLPLIGSNLAAVRIAATQSHVLARDVAAPMLQLADSLQGGDTRTGAVLNVAALASGQTAILRASDALDSAAVELRSVDSRRLLPPLRNGLGELTTLVDQARPAIDSLLGASRALPGMLGQHGPRTLLVMLQNNAELRTGGGITGTFIALRADHGILSITSQADSQEFDALPQQILPIDQSTTDLYGDVVGRFVQNTSMTPDFDLTARLASAWWNQRTGSAPDTVIAVDPLVLGAFLRVTGPVSTPEGALTSENIVDRLLVEPYRTLDQAGQTAVFEDAATAVFGALTQSRVDSLALVEALAAPIEQGRVSIWSAHAAEQKVLASTSLAGSAARHRAAGDDAYAVYLNDATGGKMDTLLDVAIASGAATCRADGRADVVVRVTLTNRAGADAAALPFSMTAGGAWGVAPGHIATSVAVAAPAGSFFGGVTVGAERVAPVDVTDAGFPVSATQVDLAPGESTTIEYRFISAGTGASDPLILHTPLVADPALSTVSPSCR